MIEGAELRLPEVAALLRREVGLRSDPRRHDAVRAALERASLAAGVPAPALVEQLLSGAAPLQGLVDEVTIGETYFFRDPAQWRFIEATVLAEAERRPRAAPFRAWSAGCSTGEEPYTLAVLLAARGLAARSRVIATDVSTAALEQARRAEFSLWSFRGGIDPRLRRYLAPHDGRFRLDPAVAKLVSFRALNLATPFSPARDLGTDALDLILCRNVLIYLEAEVVEELAGRLFAALRPGGWLVVGASDPLLTRHAPFRVEAGPHGIALQRPAAPDRPRPPRVIVAAPRRVADARVAVSPRTDRSHAAPTSREAAPAMTPAPAAPSACALCRGLLDAGRHEDARRAVEEALARSPVDPELHLMRALVLTEAGDLPGAERACRRAVYLDRRLPFPHFFLAMLRLQLGERDAAVNGLRTVIALCAGRPPESEVPLSSGLTTGALESAALFQLDALST